MPRDILELGSSLAYLDELQAQYSHQPGDVDASWHELLREGGADDGPVGRLRGNGRPPGATSAAAGASPVSGNGHATSSASGASPVSGNGRPAGVTSAAAGASPVSGNGHAVPALIWAPAAAPAPAPALPPVWPLVDAFRSYGHFNANLDPLGLLEIPRLAVLEPASWGFTEADLDRVVEPTGVHGLPRATVRELTAHLRRIYAGSVGLEYMHISAPARRAWLAERMETGILHPLPGEVRRRMLELLINAEQFERFCHTKYPGTKRFSLEGSEGLIPLLDLVLSHGARLGAIEAVLGMAHRGRLTTLEQIMRRPGRDLFAQFEDVEPEKAMGGGDVKYHLGAQGTRSTPTGDITITLVSNPSHLEAVDPIVVGRVRAKQTRHGDVEQRRVMGVLVHGDAAFAGQGLVPEVLQMSGLPGYRTGGTVHLIVNNQVGFTASPAEQRSTPYSTDVAKMIECPIWHVNGDDLDALARVVEIAAEYRAQFGSDVVIDMYCFRKYGHNEADEPSFTQPLMYEVIKRKASPVEVYARRLLEEGVVTQAEIEAMVRRRVAELEAELEAAKAARQRPDAPSMTAMWRGYRGGLIDQPDDADTRVPRQLLENIAASITEVPPGFTPHPKIERLLEQRAQMGRGDRPIDWGMAELLALGSLLHQGVNVRLSGQDSSRGTFSHRHAIITDIKTGREHLVLGGLHHDQGQCRIYDSPLSEAGVMGFEFGYSLDYPDALVMWEAQFGDFVNGAQVIIDQFITSSEDKWKRLSGLVLLLPHGYEGQGPEHSSARLERFLELCAEQNIQVVQPTTPAQYFHMLRTQLLRTLRKPLVVMTPKSLLRLPAATSTLDELATGKFHRVLPDDAADPKEVTRVLCCSGKIYYELADERARRADASVAIVRIEKLYPWWPQLVVGALERYPRLREVLWVQDEPANMGAATFIAPRLQAVLAELRQHKGIDAAYGLVSRVESASPATGSHKAHVIEQQQILAAAFAVGCG
ncbi:MAG TPA: 2-oxoglutarate dehydrogenase E1 component [Kofleriaceae bacterium]|nr:2-oxoglutarate dehydrogenase E1 component [Kofleriaceae bacterium]